MNLERTMKLGQLREQEEAAKALALKIERVRQEMRLYLAAHPRPDHLETPNIRQMADELVQTQTDYEAALTQIAALRDDLGLARYDAR